MGLQGRVTGASLVKSIYSSQFLTLYTTYPATLHRCFWRPARLNTYQRLSIWTPVVPSPQGTCPAGVVYQLTQATVLPALTDLPTLTEQRLKSQQESVHQLYFNNITPINRDNASRHVKLAAISFRRSTIRCQSRKHQSLGRAVAEGPQGRHGRYRRGSILSSSPKHCVLTASNRPPLQSQSGISPPSTASQLGSSSASSGTAPWTACAITGTACPRDSTSSCGCHCGWGLWGWSWWAYLRAWRWPRIR